MGTPSWAAQLSPDLEASRRFYAAIFGWHFDNIADKHDPPFLIATAQGTRVASLAGPVDEAVWITAVPVRQLDAAAEAAVSSGGSVCGETEIRTLGRFHKLLDPAGAEIHVMQPIPGAEPILTDEPGAGSINTLRIADISQAGSFYSSLFGWQIDDTGPVAAFRLAGHQNHRGGIFVPEDAVALIQQTTPGNKAA